MTTKALVLAALVVQNSALALTLRYSRIQSHDPYLTSTAVVVVEVVKGAASIVIYAWSQRRHLLQARTPTDLRPSSPALSPFRTAVGAVAGPHSGWSRLMLPGALYVLQNNAQLVAVSHLDAVTFQISYQGKILTTALAARLLLGRIISLRQWLSLCLLTVGVACVQVGHLASPPPIEPGDRLLGLVAVAVACTCSGAAGVSFEKIAKQCDGGGSIWVRNIQLSLSCLAVAVPLAFLHDYPAIRQNGFLQGYNWAVVLTVGVHAAGGLIVALVIQYTDNIVKVFATSISIVVSTMVSVLFFDFHLSVPFVVGSGLVIGATMLYGLPNPSPADSEVKADIVRPSEKHAVASVANLAN